MTEETGPSARADKIVDMSNVPPHLYGAVIRAYRKACACQRRAAYIEFSRGYRKGCRLAQTRMRASNLWQKRFAQAMQRCAPYMDEQ